MSASSDINYVFNTNTAITAGDCLIIEMNNPYSSYSTGELKEIRDNYNPFSATLSDCVLVRKFEDNYFRELALAHQLVFEPQLQIHGK